MIAMTKCGSATVTSFCNSFRQLVSESLGIESVTVIGGEGIEVEIDESKLGKQKYNRGHRVEGVWVIGGVERTPERKVFLAQVENRTAETIGDIISKHVKPGSIILTDLWKGYSCILTDFDDYAHYTVNHKKRFKNPETGTHTNTIEGIWNGLKMRIRPRNRTKRGINKHLFEFIWRRRNKNRLEDALLDALSYMYYD
jgi:transposase-like protein